MASANSLERSTGSTSDSIGGLSTELETIAAICTAVPEINADLRALSERVETLAASIDEQDGDAVDELQSDVESLGEVIGQLTENVTEFERKVEEDISSLESRQDELEARLATVEACFSDNLLEKQEAHTEAQDGEMPFDRGDEYEMVIKEVTEGPDPSLRGIIEKVQTFVDINERSDYTEGEVIDIVITDLNGNAAHAVPADKFGE
jgi:peptidoglycan hydrolase CwlO-like protein